MFLLFTIVVLPVWGWAPSRGGQWGGCFWAELHAPKLHRQSPETPPGRGSDGRSSSHRSPEPEKWWGGSTIGEEMSFCLYCKRVAKSVTMATEGALRTPRRCDPQVTKKCKWILWSVPHILTVRANIISLKFLFPTILFFSALTESLGLGKMHQIGQMLMIFMF